MSPRASGVDAIGLLLALGAATGLGLAVAVARLAYDGGTNGLTVASCRGLFLVVALLGFCRLSGRSLSLPLGDYLQCVALGLLMAMMFYGNVGSVEFIPVGLAALLFYTFPLIVALIQIAILREPIPASKMLAVGAAFTGLAFMLGASLSDSNPVGVALALGAAVSAAWNSVWVVRRLSHHDPLVLTAHMASIAAVVLLVVAVASDAMRAPTTDSGWLGAVLVVLLQASSIPLYYLAIARIGALPTAMASNIQPMVSIAAAYLLYGEALGPSQMAGGVLVIGAVVWMQRLQWRTHGR